MTAKITSDLTNIFVKYINGETEVFALNDHFIQIQDSLSFIIDKIIERGYNMSQLELKPITNIGESIEVFNENVSIINSYLISISELIGQDYLISKEILSTMKIDAINNNSSFGIRINTDNVNIVLGNGQEVSLKEGEVTSVLGEEILAITHA